MKKKERSYCPFCGAKVIRTEEEGILRDFCECCRIFFYENPLPVVSAVVLSDRKVLLVKRGIKPYRGRWCLPTGFAETGESIEEAALRELKEETGLEGVIKGLIDVDSSKNYYYGDLIFMTFEVEPRRGSLLPGGDTVSARYFPMDGLPRLAFSSNRKAIEAYMRSKKDLWAIVDSFSKTVGEGRRRKKKNLLSDSLIEVIEDNAKAISQIWIEDVTTNRSTPGYHCFDPAQLFTRVHRILSQFGRWLGGYYSDRDIKKFYMELGRDRKSEGFALSEVLSALSLIRKHVWEFALSRGVWQDALDIYMVLELDRRIVIFFDKAAFYATRGYEA